MATPFIRPLQVQGGTFYTFSSAARHITETFNNENTKFVFSKFAALNLPDVKSPVNQSNQTAFQNIDGALVNGLDPDVSINFAESFQNYALNFETLLLNQTGFDPDVKKTVAERVFFKWLKETGAIRFRSANALEEADAVTGSRFVEEDNAGAPQTYQRVVEYVGDIEVVNNIKRTGTAYTEIYMNMNSVVGNTPTVLFETTGDVNYFPGQVVTGGSEFIFGRQASDQHPAGIDFDAFYDYDVSLSFVDANLPWGPSSLTNSYYTEDNFNDPTTSAIDKPYSAYPIGTPLFSDFSYLRTGLDGIGIDFEASSYQQIVTNPNVSQISEFNSTADASDFAFNALLIYYDLYDVSNPADSETNLYGVLFLDNITPVVGEGGFVQRFEKFKQNPLTNLNGNSYGLKLNVKFDTSADNVGVETVINDYNSFSLELYSDALQELQDAGRIIINQNQKIAELTDQLNDLQNYVLSQTQATELNARIESLETNFANANLTIAETDTLLELIGSNSDRIESIFNGDTPLDLQFNTDSLVGGSGINVDKNVPNQVRISNTNTGYNSVTEVAFDYDFNNINTVPLNEFSNYVLETSENQQALSDVIVQIDDSTFRWETGQNLRFSFENTVDTNFFNFIFRTDAIDRFNTGLNYNKTIGAITHFEFEASGFKPVIEIVCIDSVTYRFKIDILK